MASATTSLHKHPAAIASAVALLHVGGLAALQSGLLVRAYEMIVPVEMISQIIDPPKPLWSVLPPPSVAPQLTEPAKYSKAVTLPPAPQPLAIPDPAPTPNALVGTLAASPSLPPITSPVAVSPAPAPTVAVSPAVEKIVEPEMVAEHQANEELFRPHSVSYQLGEFGSVVLLVTVGIDGRAKDVAVSKSSGFTRLDNAAMRGAMQARYKPAMRGGQAVERKFPWSIIYPEPQR